VSARGKAVAAEPSAVLRRALLAWGLGDLALGRTSAGVAWLLAEILAAAALVYLFIGLVDTTWYLVPFLAGVLFLVVWSGQAVIAYRAALRQQAGVQGNRSRAPAALMAWLTVPLLLWGTGFWLVAGSASSPAATLDRFEASWPELAGGGLLDPGLRADDGVSAAAHSALGTLQQLCAQGELSGDCSTSNRTLLRDVRITIAPAGPSSATAVATVVTFERRPSQFLGIFAATELVAVPRRTVLTLQLQADPASLPGGLEPGAQRWRIISARPS
jgi:hypothetical protein